LAGVKIKAHLSIHGEKRPSLIQLKTFCSQHLPVYMVPDVFSFHDSLPRLSNDKVDYESLKNLA
jgi:acyl-CoA synthetase (AMP-forming)/AMP-acid ligase II